MIDRTDRDVYRLVQQRQRAAIGTTSDADIGAETGNIDPTSRMYRRTPRSAPKALPADMGTRTPAKPDAAMDGEADTIEAPSHDATAALQEAERIAGSASDTQAPPLAEAIPPYSESESAPEAAAEDQADEEDDLISTDIFTEAERAELVTFGLTDAIGYAMRHARQLQNAKEDLYLAALDLTLERHLWTPQFVASVSADYAEDRDAEPADRALSTVAEVSIEQRLPFGGSVTAKVINSLMRNLAERVTSGESGQVILQADVPLFRGAGRVAYESRYESERGLVYAVRTFERFRRNFAVQVAGDYFDLQQAKAGIDNAHKSYVSRRYDWEKAEFTKDLGQSQTIFDASRARASYRSAEASLVSAKERYASALDRFKILIGMSVDQPLDVLSQGLDPYGPLIDELCPNVDEARAVAVALDYRLDVLTSRDRIDDAKRGVIIAENKILPDLNLSGSVAFDPDGDHLDSANYSAERSSYRAGVQLRIDDRKSERNAYRRSLVTLRRTERQHEEFEDSVRADVRQALRRIDQQADLRAIQELSVKESFTRTEAARAQVELNKATYLDLVDAEDELLSARNALAAAVAAYRNAILAFRLDTGTLWITDTGTWVGVEHVDTMITPTPADATHHPESQGRIAP